MVTNVPYGDVFVFFCLLFSLPNFLSSPLPSSWFFCSFISYGVPQYFLQPFTFLFMIMISINIQSEIYLAIPATYLTCTMLSYPNQLFTRTNTIFCNMTQTIQSLHITPVRLSVSNTHSLISPHLCPFCSAHVHNHFHINITRYHIIITEPQKLISEHSDLQSIFNTTRRIMTI